MAAVYHIPSKDTRDQNVRVKRRKRSPLGNVAAWCVKKAASTALQKPVNLFAESLVGRVAAAITMTLILGILVDLSFQFLPSPHGFIVCVVIGAVAGGAMQGAGGAIVGLFWGWLLGKIVDATVAKISNEQTVAILGTLGAWCLAATMGWFAGRVTAWGYEKLVAKYSRLRPIIAGIAVTVSLAAVAIFLFELGTWVIQDYASISSKVVLWLTCIWSTITQWFASIQWGSVALSVLSWAFIIVDWLIALGVLYLWKTETIEIDMEGLKLLVLWVCASILVTYVWTVTIGSWLFSIIAWIIATVVFVLFYLK